MERDVLSLREDMYGIYQDVPAGVFSYIGGFIFLHQYNDSYAYYRPENVWVDTNSVFLHLSPIQQDFNPEHQMGIKISLYPLVLQNPGSKWIYHSGPSRLLRS